LRAAGKLDEAPRKGGARSSRHSNDDLPGRHAQSLSAPASGVRQESCRVAIGLSARANRAASTSSVLFRFPRDSFFGARSGGLSRFDVRNTLRQSNSAPAGARHVSRLLPPATNRRRCRWRTPDRERSMRTKARFPD
jgi:hypothetical protein